MERIIRKLLLAWVLLLGTLSLVQVLPLPASAGLGYALVWVIALTSPVVALLILWLLVLQMRESLHRVRVLWRARHWRRNRPTDGRWMDPHWEEVGNGSGLR